MIYLVGMRLVVIFFLKKKKHFHKVLLSIYKFICLSDGIWWQATKPAFTCSNLTIEILEQGIK